MKILHVSDLHFGKSMSGYSLIEDQEYNLELLYKMIEENNPDYLLVAGDVFDKSVPSVEATKLLDSFLLNISKFKNMKTIIISGNHDQADRLNYASSFLKHNNIFIYANQNKLEYYEDDYISLLPICYLSLANIRLMYENVSDEIMGHKMIIDDFFKKAKKDTIKVCMCHNFIAGGATSDSERELSVGGALELPTSLFKDFSYVALGHLHMYQHLASNIYYSGSPIKFSISEANNKNCALLYDTEGKNVERLYFKNKRDVVVIKDTYDNVVSNSTYAKKDDYVFVELTSDGIVYDAFRKLKMIYPNLLGIKNKQQMGSLASSSNIQIERQTDLEVFESFYTYITGNELDDVRRKIVEESIENAGGDK